MRINGRWTLCDDGVVRPLIAGTVLTGNGKRTTVEFLVDVGADRTVFDYLTLAKLGVSLQPTGEKLSGLGGLTGSVALNAKIELTQVSGRPASFNGSFAAVNDPTALDMSVLGRDILDLFAVIIDRPGDVVCLLRDEPRCW